MTQQIHYHLQRFAQENGFRILYACETGSRGWGFASPDSDFDIRFIYVFPQERYLQLREPQEQISTIFEDSGEVLDFNGWELRKTLRLLSGANASPYEWLQSPIIYDNIDNFRSSLWDIAGLYHSPRSAIHHYLGICHNSLKSGIEGDSINIKKYFYVLRPLLAAKWAADRRTVPHMQFAPLLAQIPADTAFRKAVAQLWMEKERAPEGAMTPLVPAIQDFISTEMEHCKSVAEQMEKRHVDTQALDVFFKQWL
jgi:uncharacterized protein